MGRKHNSKEFDNLVKEAIKLGFSTRINGGKIMLMPPDKNFPIYMAHRGDQGVKPLKNYLKKYLDFIGKKI